MSKEVINILDALAERFGLAIDWTSANVIPYLEKLCSKCVNYEITTSAIWFLIGVICLFVSKWGLKQTKIFIKKYEDNSSYNYNDLWAIFSGIGTGILIIVGLLISIKQIFDITTCLTFTEKIIIEELKMISKSI